MDTVEVGEIRGSCEDTTKRIPTPYQVGRVSELETIMKEEVEEIWPPFRTGDLADSVNGKDEL